MKSVLQEHDAQLIENYNGIVGLDEVGRGALAGPVFTAACWIKPGFFEKAGIWTLTSEIRDSKKMSKKKRSEASERLAYLKSEGLIDYALASASVKEIDRYNIAGATQRAFVRSLEKVVAGKLISAQPLILVDGRPLKGVSFEHKAIVGGDDRSLAIAMASILAKVARDQWMEVLHLDFPQYDWKSNKGYGTLAHREGIRAHGVCCQHRTLFLRKILNK